MMLEDPRDFEDEENAEEARKEYDFEDRSYDDDI